MASIVQEMRFVVDVRAGLVVQPQRAILNKDDANANRIVVCVVDGKKEVDLTGVSVTGAYYRPGDGARVPLEGTVSGNEASVTMTEHCYTEEGQYEAEVRLTQGNVTRTILSITGYMHRAGSGAVVDVSGVIPSLDALLAQIQATKDAAAAANQAAAAASAAAENANEKAEGADEAAKKAEEAAEGAEAWANAEATAQAIAPGETPTVEVSEEDGKKVIHFSIPRGDTGATPEIEFQVATGAAGTQVQVQQSGTAEKPVIKLTIPRGDTGAVEGVDYFEGNPSPLGVANPGTANGLARGDHVHPMPTAEQVGALEKNGTAANANQLNGKNAEQYMLKTDTAADSAKLGGVEAESYLLKANAFVMELLWENPTPTNTFGKQTITPAKDGIPIDLSVYSHVMIKNRRYNAVERSSNEICATGSAGTLGKTTTADSTYKFDVTNRHFDVNGDGILFYDASAGNATSAPAVNNMYHVPTTIYGIKGVTSL